MTYIDATLLIIVATQGVTLVALLIMQKRKALVDQALRESEERFRLGPQGGYFFPFGSSKGYVNLRGYYEFGAKHRIEGWNMSLTLSLPF